MRGFVLLVEVRTCLAFLLSDSNVLWQAVSKHNQFFSRGYVKLCVFIKPQLHLHELVAPEVSCYVQMLT